MMSQATSSTRFVGTSSNGRTGEEIARQIIERHFETPVTAAGRILIDEIDFDGGAYGEPVYVRFPAALVEAASGILDNVREI
jgi:hypothetical protein